MIAYRAPARYRAYMLRLWQERSWWAAGPAVWRFSLEDPHNGARRGYATLEELIDALRRELEQAAEADQHLAAES
jgi:hypothetical protein